MEGVHILLLWFTFVRLPDTCAILKDGDHQTKPLKHDCNTISPNDVTASCPHSNNSTSPIHATRLVVRQGGATSICDALTVFTKYVKVFDLHVIATPSTPDDKLLHAASIVYQYIDNDDDGEPDNSLVYATLVRIKATLFMFCDRHELNKEVPATKVCDKTVESEYLEANEMHPGSIVRFSYDESYEECFHFLTNAYMRAYPDVFGSKPASHITELMDCARGGYFAKTPDTYPLRAWYTYRDKSCKYHCMVVEYIYWGWSTIHGAQRFRKADIQDEWRVATCEALKKVDPALFMLLLDPVYKFPKRLPVKVFDVLVEGDVDRGDDDVIDADGAGSPLVYHDHDQM